MVAHRAWANFNDNSAVVPTDRHAEKHGVNTGSARNELAPFRDGWLCCFLRNRFVLWRLPAMKLLAWEARLRVRKGEV
jgi:hypothetical protein